MEYKLIVVNSRWDDNTGRVGYGKSRIDRSAGCCTAWYCQCENFSGWNYSLQLFVYSIRIRHLPKVINSLRESPTKEVSPIVGQNKSKGRRAASKVSNKEHQVFTNLWRLPNPLMPSGHYGSQSRCDPQRPLHFHSHSFVSPSLASYQFSTAILTAGSQQATAVNLDAVHQYRTPRQRVVDYIPSAVRPPRSRSTGP